MHQPDVVQIRQFYASEAGGAARALLHKRMARFWPQLPPGEAVLGLGFALPYLAGEGALAACPAQLGAMYWPHGAPNRVAMADEGQLPFPDNAFNRVLMIHALEYARHAGEALREIWRVLVPGGRLLLAVPNRWGLWAQSGGSPFGHGRPFSASQLKVALEQAGLTCLRHQAALAMPPMPWRFALRAAPWVETGAEIIGPRFGGVLVMEAEKQVYAALAEPVKARGTSVLMPIPAYGATASVTTSGVSNCGSSFGSPRGG